MGLMEVLRSQGNTVLDVKKYTGLLKNEYTLGFPESLEYVAQTAVRLASNQNVPVDLKQKLFDGVEDAFSRQLKVAPQDVRYLVFHANFLSRFGWYGRAIEQLNKAIEVSPKKQGVYFELINNLIADKKFEEAIKTAKTAYELDPSYKEAKIIYGLTAFASNNTPLANEILSTIDKETLVFDDRVLQIFVSQGLHDRVIEIAKNRVAMRPNDPQQLLTLAAAYLDAGRRQDSINTLRKAIDLDPTFRQKGEYFIKEIESGKNP
jgi:tetratricopeptide (TPR) repeat protein